MKLAVIGDSFADFSSESTPRDVEYAWFNILAEKLDAKLYHKALRGGSVYNSYKSFLTLYQKCDLIIFIVTNPERYTKVFTFSDGHKRVVGSAAYCDYLRNTFEGLTEDDYKILDGIQNYLMFDDYEFKNDMSELMLQHIKSLHSNVIFYPSFAHSFQPERKKKEKIPNKYCLNEIQKKQMNQLRLDSDTLFRETDLIVGHLVHEYNAAFANVLHSRIASGYFNFSFFDNVHKIKLDKDYYYEFN